MIKLKFENPPEPDYVQHADVAKLLRRRPNQWARVGDYANPPSARSTAQSIRKAGLRAYAPAGAYEAISREVDGQHVVYARYVGVQETRGETR